MDRPGGHREVDRPARHVARDDVRGEEEAAGARERLHRDELALGDLGADLPTERPGVGGSERRGVRVGDGPARCARPGSAPTSGVSPSSRVGAILLKAGIPSIGRYSLKPCPAPCRARMASSADCTALSTSGLPSAVRYTPTARLSLTGALSARKASRTAKIGSGAAPFARFQHEPERAGEEEAGPSSAMSGMSCAAPAHELVRAIGEPMALSLSTPVSFRRFASSSATPTSTPVFMFQSSRRLLQLLPPLSRPGFRQPARPLRDLRCRAGAVE